MAHDLILSSETHALIQAAYTERGLSKHVLDTDLRRQGATDVRDLDGQQILDLLAAMELRGVDRVKFKADRRTVVPG